MKWIERVIRYSLICMILLSLVLSARIWLNSGKVPANKNDSNTISNKVIQEKAATDVFLPTKLVYHMPERLRLSNRESLLNNVVKQIAKSQFLEFSGVKVDNNFSAKVNKKETIELSFPGKISFTYFEHIYQAMFHQGAELVNFKFNYLYLSFLDKKIYFYNDSTKQYLSARFVKDDDIQKIMNFVKDEQNQYIEVTVGHEILPHNYYTVQPIKLKKYNYILASQSYTMFSQAFFHNLDELSSNDDTANMSLTNSEGEVLTLNSKNGEVSYFGKVQNELPKAEKNNYGYTFQYLARTGNAFGNIRYFQSQHNILTYRNYVEGYPVFGENKKGSIEFRIINANLRILTNQETIQVPIPSDETVELETTETVINYLINSGIDLSELKDIQIGYTWKNSQDNQQLVELVPEWYALYQNKWQPVTKVITEQR